MAEPIILGDYDRYTREELVAAVVNRDLLAPDEADQRNRDRIINLLILFDGNIDIRDYQYLSRDLLQEIASLRGLVLGNNLTTEDYINFLRLYDEGTIPEEFIAEPKIYRYAMERKRLRGGATPPTPTITARTVEPRTPQANLPAIITPTAVTPRRQIPQLPGTPTPPTRPTDVGVTRRRLFPISPVEKGKTVVFEGETITLPTVEQLRNNNVEELENFLARFNIPSGGLSNRTQILVRAIELRSILLNVNNDLTTQSLYTIIPTTWKSQRFVIPGQVTFMSDQTIEQLTIPQLRVWLDRHGVGRAGANTKPELIRLVKSAQQNARDGLDEHPTLVRQPNIAASNYIRRVLTNRSAITAKKYRIMDVVNSFDFNNPEIIIRTRWVFEDNVIQTPIEAIMNIKNNQERQNIVNSLLIKLGFPEWTTNNFNFIQQINLLYWYYISIKPYSYYNDLHQDEKRVFQEILNYGPDYIRELFSDMAPGNLPDDALYFLLVTGIQPDIHEVNNEAIQEVNNYTPHEIWMILRYLYGYYPGNIDITPSTRSPYEEFLSRPPSHLIPFLVEMKNSEIDNLASQVGMVFPPDIFVATNKVRKEYYTGNLRFYTDVFTRPQDLEPPPVLEDFTPDEIMIILNYYSDDELLDAYEITFAGGPDGGWSSRPDFLKKIAHEATGGSIWSFRNRKCANMPGENIVTYEERSMDDPSDPLISYGTLNNYRCYQISELEGSFRLEDKGDFLFGVPDFGITFGQEGKKTREFPIQSIRQLLMMIEEENKPKIYGDLIKKIGAGLVAKANVNLRISALRKEYLNFPPEWQEVVQVYLYLLFELGMYMRFWKGPGEPFPLKWIEGGGDVEAGREVCTTTKVRTENTNRIYYLRNVILRGDDPRDPSELRQILVDYGLEGYKGPEEELRNWLLALPRITYDFFSQSASLGRETINYVVEESEKGIYCLADASDRLLQTSYYLIINMFSISNDDFNTNLRELIGAPNQPSFDPTVITKTHHTDPTHTLQDEDD